jgi:hypothetical protein
LSVVEPTSRSAKAPRPVHTHHDVIACRASASLTIVSAVSHFSVRSVLYSIRIQQCGGLQRLGALFAMIAGAVAVADELRDVAHQVNLHIDQVDCDSESSARLSIG